MTAVLTPVNFHQLDAPHPRKPEPSSPRCANQSERDEIEKKKSQLRVAMVARRELEEEGNPAGEATWTVSSIAEIAGRDRGVSQGCRCAAARLQPARRGQAQGREDHPGC